jgi:VanZ family protein
MKPTEKNRNRGNKCRDAAVLFWAVLIFTVSSIPSLRAPDIGFQWQDKLGHFIEYFILAVLCARAVAVRNHTPRSLFTVSLIMLLSFAAVDEIHQFLIPGRVPDFMDFISDTSGILAGLILYGFLSNK